MIMSVVFGVWVMWVWLCVEDTLRVDDGVWMLSCVFFL